MPAVAHSYSSRGMLNRTVNDSARLSGTQGHDHGQGHGSDSGDKASDLQKRDALVLEHAPMVRRIALHLADRLDGAGDADDLIQSGLIGLLEAAERYTEIEGIPFEGYAYPRIRGAMMDSLRRNDWCPRNVRKQARHLQEARRRLQQELGRNPDEIEVAEQAGLSLDESNRTRMALDSAGIVSLENVMESGESLLPVDIDRASVPVEKQRWQKALVAALKQLPEREQIIMSLYYDDELNQKEIALALELTEARISQLRSKAIKTLSKKLSEWM